MELSRFYHGRTAEVVFTKTYFLLQVRVASHMPSEYKSKGQCPPDTVLP
jgi:hypothetical protein